MQPNKKQTFLYSLWMAPVLMTGLLNLILISGLHNAPVSTYEGYALDCPLIAVGYLIAAMTSKQKKDWSIFWIFIAAYFIIIAISNAVGLNNRETGCTAGAILFFIYTAAGCVLAFFIRRRVIAGAMYAGTDEYKALKKAEKEKSYQKAGEKVRNPGKPKVMDAAPAGSALAGAFTKEPVTSGTAGSSVPPAPSAQAVKADPVRRETDVNTCSIEELMSLPGVSLADAKRVILERETNGEFASVEDFISRSGWKPHTVARFIDDLKVSHIHEDSSQKRRGRALDL